MLDNPGLQNPTLRLMCKLRILFDVEITYSNDKEDSAKSTKRAWRFASKEPFMHGSAFFDGITPGNNRTLDRIGLLLVALHRDERPILVEDADGERVTTITNRTYYYLIVESTGVYGYYRRIGTGTRCGLDIWHNTVQTVVHLV
jgi:hypothetical protein